MSFGLQSAPLVVTTSIGQAESRLSWTPGDVSSVISRIFLRLLEYNASPLVK